jgi:uncharacterized protein YjbJ (UPF0337 family)
MHLVLTEPSSREGRLFSPSSGRFPRGAPLIYDPNEFWTEEVCLMNWDQVKGNWKQVTGKVKEKWGKLTDDDLTSIAGKRDQLVGKLQERYGYEKTRAEQELDDFARALLP